MEAAVITGLFSVVSATAGAIITKYGFHYFGRSKKIICSGNGKDVDLSFICESLEDKRPFAYNIPSCTIIKRGKKVSLIAHVEAKGSDGTNLNWTMKAKGKLQDGIAYCTYTDDLHNSSVKWNGVLSLSFSSGGEVIGLWVTENTKERGKMAFGMMQLNTII
jgi:hypothetical protein